MRAPVNANMLLKSKSRGMVVNAEGTWAFYSPEMCAEERESYSAYQADVWAVCVCFWIFLCGTLPYDAEDPYEIFSVIREHDPVPPHPLSSELSELFRSLLNKDPTKRLGLDDILNHPLIRIPSRRPSLMVGLNMVDLDSAFSSAITVTRSDPVPLIVASLSLFKKNLYKKLIKPVKE
eukprot:CAMPEP_0182438040 /NCGR_PEP_ID=MMETSP1167-20130531/85406_1 /TAXON_ID=2988 /ORGANISM="Mallomonas Sp, Strain CCMP3275" /LENGTH=177 /DNA_ID=CAMNT_0024631199 /DNA_START=270 /DNA_END=804 /DNA_ORIENTATION=-